MCAEELRSVWRWGKGPAIRRDCAAQRYCTGSGHTATHHTAATPHRSSRLNASQHWQRHAAAHEQRSTATGDKRRRSSSKGQRRACHTRPLTSIPSPLRTSHCRLTAATATCQGTRLHHATRHCPHTTALANGCWTASRRVHTLAALAFDRRRHPFCDNDHQHPAPYLVCCLRSMVRH